MTKVKFASNQEHEFINNWKILQKAFKAAGVDKVSFILVTDFNSGLHGNDLFQILFDMYDSNMIAK